METGNLRNEDFRKLLGQKRTEAPKAAAEAKPKSSTGNAAFSHKQAKKAQYKKKGGVGHKHKKATEKETKKKDDDEEDDEEADTNLKEILKNYRDRAAERRTKGDEPAEADPRLAGAYRAVPGDRRAAFDAAVKRQQAIEESKYLGGDMEHTHLVKGLDFSLLHKIRAEIVKKGDDDDRDEDDDLEEALHDRKVRKSYAVAEEEKPPESLMARNIHRLLLKNEPPLRNDNFGKGRMAYIVELDDETTDVPTTLLRSVHDCPVTESNATVSADKILISKLTQVLAYLRTDTKKKQKLKEVFGTEEELKKVASESIFGDAGEYVPRKEKDERDKNEREREKDGGISKKDYFADSRRDDKERDRRDDRYGRERGRGDRERDREAEERRRAEEKEREELRARAEEEKKLQEKLAKRKRETEGYDECYPGGLMDFGEEDSDDEDGPPNKKGRAVWGEEEDPSKFNKASRTSEVKAAYQYGVKKGDGRKSGKEQDRKLDQELTKINNLIEKRKGEGADAPRMRF